MSLLIAAVVVFGFSHTVEVRLIHGVRGGRFCCGCMA